MKYVAALVTVIGGQGKTKVDPRIAPRPLTASLTLAQTFAASARKRARVQRERREP